MANLMNLTKKQLIEIIERKDVVEKQHVSEVKSLKAKVEKSTLTEEGLNVKIQDLERRIKGYDKDMEGTEKAYKELKGKCVKLEEETNTLNAQLQVTNGELGECLSKAEYLIEEKLKLQQEVKFYKDLSMCLGVIAICVFLLLFL